jgi:hypothetical protein
MMVLKSPGRTPPGYVGGAPERAGGRDVGGRVPIHRGGAGGGFEGIRWMQGGGLIQKT